MWPNMTLLFWHMFYHGFAHFGDFWKNDQNDFLVGGGVKNEMDVKILRMICVTKGTLRMSLHLIN